MARNHFKNWAALFVMCCFFIKPVCFAQIKENETSWYSLKWYDDIWWNSTNPHQNPILKVKDPNWYVKNACRPDDFIKGRNDLGKKYLRNAYIEQKDYLDENDKEKVKSATLTVFHNQIQTKYGAALLLEKLIFYRNKSDCMTDKERLLKLMSEDIDYERKIDKRYK